jgi:hypothetical protein
MRIDFVKRVGAVARIVVLAFALCAMSSTAALAQPHFKASGLKFKTTSATSTITFWGTGTTLVTCTADKGFGTEAGSTLTSPLMLEGCTSSRHCPASIGMEPSGELGKVAAAEATSEVGMMLKVGTEFTCGTELVVLSGTVAAEVTPLTSNTKHEFKYIETAAFEQKIQSITVAGGLTHPELVAKINGGAPARLVFKSTETNEFTTAIDIVTP